MPGARRTARSVLAVAVTVGALLRELTTCGCGPADLVAAPRPEGSRPAGRGMPPGPESARCPPTLSGSGKVSASAHAPARWPRVPVSERGHGRTARRAEGVPLKPYRKLSQAKVLRRCAVPLDVCPVKDQVRLGKKCYAGLGIGGTADRPACPKRRTVELVAWPVVTEDPWQPEGLVSWLPPDLLAARRAAIDFEMAAAGCLSGGAVAWLPADAHRAGSPRVMTAALLGEVQGLRSALLNRIIQT